MANYRNYDTIDLRTFDAHPRRRRSCCKCYLIIFSALVVLFGFLLFIGVPLTFYLSSTFRRTMLFQAYTASPDGLNDPESYGLPCSRNFFIDSDRDIKVGAWYVQSGAIGKCLADESRFPAKNKVVLYLHGIFKSRSAANRVQLLRMLTQEVFVHAVTIDYRGYGDSTNELPSLQGVVADSYAAYKLLLEVRKNSEIVIWGHSLGTAVTMHLLAKLHGENISPSAVVLEAALDDIGSVSLSSRLLKPFRWMPCFETIFPGSLMRDPTTAFNSTDMVFHVDRRVKILLLHSRDDKTIPFEHGLHLYKKFRDFREKTGDAASVTMLPFRSDYEYGHNRIVFHPGLAHIVSEFLVGKMNRTEIIGDI